MGSVPWVVYYSDKANIRQFESFDLLVLDSKYHPALQPLKAQNKKMLGYLSLGEVESHRSYFTEVKNQNMLLMENKFWPGSFFVDLRNPLWTQRVIEDLIPAILHQGFDGIFIDTMDNPGHLERTDPVKYKGMVKAAVNLLRAIKIHYPKVPVMLNRGYELYPKGAQYVEMVLGESIYTDYDFDKKAYKVVKGKDYKLQVKWLKDAKKKKPSLQVFTLDYWDPKDKKGIEQIYKVQRTNGFHPYVSTIKLDTVIQEPR